MSTTALAVELLIIGYQALIWIVLVVFLFPVDSAELLKPLKDWKELIIIGSMVAAYTTGAIVNGVTTKIFEKLKIDKLIYKLEEPPSKLRAVILARKPEAFIHIIKNLNDPRLLRSTIINILLIGAFTFVHLNSSTALTRFQLGLIVFLFIVGVFLSAWAWYETAENFYVHLIRTFDEVTKNDQPIEKK